MTVGGLLTGLSSAGGTVRWQPATTIKPSASVTETTAILRVEYMIDVLPHSLAVVIADPPAAADVVGVAHVGLIAERIAQGGVLAVGGGSRLGGRLIRGRTAAEQTSDNDEVRVSRHSLFRGAPARLLDVQLQLERLAAEPSCRSK